MFKNNEDFLILSLVSDLQNISQGIVAGEKDQTKEFIEHATNLCSKVGVVNKQQIDQLLRSKMPINEVERIKLADKFLTWSAILQTSIKNVHYA